MGSSTPIENGKRTDPRRNLNNFEFVRLFAAWCVLVGHQYALSGRVEPTLLGVHSIAGFGVLIFFSISGYLVTSSWLTDPSACRFAARRMLRIWPGLAVAVALTALVLGPSVSGLSLPEYLGHPKLMQYLHNLKFDLRDELPLSFVGSALPSAVNGSLWTIPLELTCYTVLVACGVGTMLERRRLTAALVLLVVISCYAVVPRGFMRMHSWSIENFYLFEFGLFFAIGGLLRLFNAMASRSRVRLVLVAGWTCFFAALSANRPLLGLLAVVPATSVAVGLSRWPLISRLGRWGDISYGTYLYAFPIQQTVIWLWHDKVSWPVLLLASVAFTTAMASVSWFLVERPALRWRPAAVFG